MVQNMGKIILNDSDFGTMDLDIGTEGLKNPKRSTKVFDSNSNSQRV